MRTTATTATQRVQRLSGCRGEGETLEPLAMTTATTVHTPTSRTKRTSSTFDKSIHEDSSPGSDPLLARLGARPGRITIAGYNGDRAVASAAGRLRARASPAVRVHVVAAELGGARTTGSARVPVGAPEPRTPVSGLKSRPPRRVYSLVTVTIPSRAIPSRAPQRLTMNDRRRFRAPDPSRSLRSASSDQSPQVRALSNRLNSVVVPVALRELVR